MKMIMKDMKENNKANNLRLGAGYPQHSRRRPTWRGVEVQRLYLRR